MDGITGRTARLFLTFAVLTSAGCSNASWWPIRPFGAVHTYTGTVVPGPQGHPRGHMVPPQSPGIDLVRKSGSLDPAARPASSD
jgi:hypothetical protein